MTAPNHPTTEFAADGFVESRGGLQIRWRRFEPSDPKATLLITPGLAEHGNRYGYVIDHLVPKGFACWTVDLRGHGESEGRRVHVERFDDYLADIGAVHRLAIEQTGAGALPFFVLGHSMGGLVTLRYLLANDQAQGPITGGIVSSPLLASHPSADPPWILDRIAQVLSKLTPGLLFPSDLDTSAISRDPAIVEAYEADPLVGGKVSARWYTELRIAMADTRARAAELSVPILLMQSGADRLVDPAATRRFAADAPEELVDEVVWPGFFHEMLNEPERGQVLDRIVAWLGDRI